MIIVGITKSLHVTGATTVHCVFTAAPLIPLPLFPSRAKNPKTHIMSDKNCKENGYSTKCITYYGELEAKTIFFCFWIRAAGGEEGGEE